MILKLINLSVLISFFRKIVQGTRKDSCASSNKKVNTKRWGRLYRVLL